MTPERLRHGISLIYHEKYPQQSQSEFPQQQQRQLCQSQLEEPQYQRSNAGDPSNPTATNSMYLPVHPNAQPHIALNNLFQFDAFLPTTLSLTPTNMEELLDNWDLHLIPLYNFEWQHYDANGKPLYTLGLMIYMGGGVWIPVRRFGIGGRFWVNLDPSLSGGVERLGRKGLTRIVERIREILDRNRDVDKHNSQGIGVYKLVGRAVMQECRADSVLKQPGFEWPIYEDIIEDENDLLFKMDGLTL